MTALGTGRIAFAALAAALLWRIVHVNAVVYGDSVHPTMRMEPGTPQASYAQLLRVNPAEVGALAGLADARMAAGDRAGAGQALAVAREIAPVDPRALRSEAAFDLAEGHVGEAISRLDALAEARIEARAWIFPLFAQVVTMRADEGRFAQLAARGTGWMGPFLAYACEHAIDPMAVAGVLLPRIAAGQARGEEVACATERLRAAGRWDAAYRLWLDTLAPERLSDVGYVFNGGFEHAPSGMGFDWIAPPRSPAWEIDYPANGAARGDRALRVSFTGKRLTGWVIRQYLALAPGRYRLTGLARSEALQSVRGLQWVVKCVQPPSHAATIAASEPFLGTAAWRAFGFDVTIDAACAGQALELEPVGLRDGTPFVAGRAWFDDLRLTRAR